MNSVSFKFLFKKWVLSFVGVYSNVFFSSINCLFCSQHRQSKPSFDCNYNVPKDLATNGIPFGAKSHGGKE